METDYRREFADFEDVVYLNTAYQGPLPLAAVRAAEEALQWKMRPYRLPDKIHFDLPDRVREKIGRIIGARPDEIAITAGASSGMASVAAGIAWKPGDEVLIARGEFPSHLSTWLPYERAGKLKMRIFSPRGHFVTAGDYLENIGSHTRVVSASVVRFDDGARLDAARVAAACHSAGAALLLDASQCAGAMPMDTRELGADFIVSSGYKWFLGPYGTGFFWVAPEAAQRLQTGPLYYQALEGARNFHTLPLENLRAVPGAFRWDSPETANFTNLAALDASLDLILRVGVDAIARHNDRFVSEIIQRLPECFTLASPAGRERRGPYVCLSARDPEQTKATFERLREARIFVSLREGALRIAPYLYNTPEHVSRVIDVLSGRN
ncbi:MAG: aminotransferase class V-fold PLP-dependent enzyme [Candidatus Acidiferrales bacterium]